MTVLRGLRLESELPDMIVATIPHLPRCAFRATHSLQLLRENRFNRSAGHSPHNGTGHRARRNFRAEKLICDDFEIGFQSASLLRAGRTLCRDTPVASRRDPDVDTKLLEPAPCPRA